MSYFLVPIRGDIDQAIGLLASAGIHTASSRRQWIGPGRSADAPTQDVTARLVAEDADAARAQVVAALGVGPFTVGDAKPE